MRPFMFLIYLLLSALVVFLYSQAVVYTALFLFDFKEWLFILMVSIAVVVTKGLMSGVLGWLKGLVSRFNSYGTIGRKFVITLAWAVSLYYFASATIIAYEHPVTQSILIIPFYGVAFMVLLVNFCYTMFDQDQAYLRNIRKSAGL